MKIVITYNHRFYLAFCLLCTSLCLIAQSEVEYAMSEITQLASTSGAYIGTAMLELEEGCIEGDCFNGNGRYYFSRNKAIYQGGFKFGLPDGHGNCEYQNKEKYEGSWESGFFQGTGMLTLRNGEKIIGEWDKSTYQGRKVKQLSSPTVERVKAANNIYAIVIGISNYPNMPALKYSDDDAYKMYAHLKSPEGGGLKDDNIRLLIDEAATKETIENTFIDVFSHCTSEDMVFVYYSGHGLEDAMLPIDFDGVRNKVYYDKIQKIIEASEAKQKFLVVDACHSGNAFREKNGLNKYKCFDKIEQGTIVMLSSKEVETSLESEGLRQGVFSHFLMKGMSGQADNNADMQITIDELFLYVKKRVVDYTGGRQHPILRGDFRSNSIIAHALK